MAGGIADRLAEVGRSPSAATTWAYGIVGMVQLAAHWWAGTRAVPADELVDQLTALADGGLSALLPPRRLTQRTAPPAAVSARTPASAACSSAAKSWPSAG